MALKLLDPSDARQRAQRSLDADKHRLVEIQDLIVQKHKELSQVEGDFTAALEKQRTQWVKELADFEEKHGVLKKQVEGLEDRKARALIPLTKLEEELHTKHRSLEDWEVQLHKKEADLADTSDTLATRLDEVAERELHVADREKAVLAKEKGIQAQADDVVVRSKQLSEAMHTATTQIADAEKVLVLREAAIKAKELRFEERVKDYDQKDKDLKKREAVLADRTATLARAFNELKTKQRGGRKRNNLPEGDS